MAEIQTRLAYVCCVRQLESVKSSEYCDSQAEIGEITPSESLSPHSLSLSLSLSLVLFIQGLSVCLQDVGYQHGKTVFSVWERSGVVETMLKDWHQEEFHKTQNSNAHTCPNASFTDLAEIVSRIEPASKQSALEADESEYQTDYDEDTMLSDFDFSEHTEDETADTGDTDEDVGIRLRRHQMANSTSSSPFLAS
ncbi:patatin-like phospholipase domain-containing protein 7 [Alosa alosa]|uniref:patatin-like phospholipase domain-containing protein 7 n=1 Tax=Alosa alosa TaxID=278164 RepID=UPI0020154127|nr:patatin-like phospholipase domain-containing protein 7 [Alosa alosa]